MIADLLRATLIDGLALVFAVVLAPALRGWGLAAGAALALTPALVVAWAWAVGPWAGLHPHADALHGLLAAARLAPWLALIAMLLPEPIPPAALHAADLAQGRAGASWWWCMRGPGRRWLTAALACWPFAFGEFELASRFAVDAWAVRQFDAQAGGLPLAQTVVQALPGMICVLAMIAAAVVISPKSGEVVAAGHASVRRRAISWAMLLCLLSALVLWPLYCVGTAARGAFADASAGLKPALAMAVIGGGAAAAAWIAAGWLRTRPVLAIALCVPGCLSGLTLGLCTAAVLPGGLAATPLPWLAVLTLLLLPPAVLLRRLSAPPAEPSHAAVLLAADPQRGSVVRHLQWLLAGRRAWLACSALAVLGCWELPASALLHPTAMPSLPVQLYNLMHYGESPALATRLALAVAVPLLPSALFAGVLRRG